MRQPLNTDTILGAVAILAGGTLLASSYQQSAAVFVLPGDAPPFLVPQLFLYITMVLGFLTLIGGLRRGGVDLGEIRWANIAIVVTVVVLATALLKTLGYLVVTPLAAISVVLLQGFRNHVANVLVAIGVVAFLYILLVKFAQMPLPKIPGLEI